MHSTNQCDHGSHLARESSPHQQACFLTTRWSLVLAAGRADSSTARDALEELCRAYWYPLYAFARRSGQSAPDAEDLVQSFFLKCVERRYLVRAAPEKGRFRTFLLTAFKRFAANEWDRARAAKRGGGQPVVALDGLAAEHRYALEPADEQSADHLYDRRWALTLLERVLEQLAQDYQAAGQAEQFQVLKETLTQPGGGGHARLAEQLGMSPGAVKVAAHRLRRRYRQRLDAEIAQTVATPEEIAGERRELLAIVAR